MTYQLFKVYDYKGGELSFETNLDLDSLVGELMERTLDNIYDYSKSKQFTREDVKKLVTMADIEGDTYAGGEGLVIEIFECNNDKLVHANLEPILEACRNYVYEYTDKRYRNVD